MKDTFKVLVGMIIGVIVSMAVSSIVIKDLTRSEKDNLEKIATCEAILPRNKFCELVAVPK